MYMEKIWLGLIVNGETVGTLYLYYGNKKKNGKKSQKTNPKKWFKQHQDHHTSFCIAFYYSLLYIIL